MFLSEGPLKRVMPPPFPLEDDSLFHMRVRGDMNVCGWWRKFPGSTMIEYISSRAKREPWALFLLSGWGLPVSYIRTYFFGSDHLKGLSNMICHHVFLRIF